MSIMLKIVPLVLAAAPFAAQAQDAKLGVGLGASTMGAELELVYPYSQSMSFRGFYAGGLSQDFNETQGDVDYDIKAKLGGFGALIDYHPFASGWRFSGGVFASDTSITATSTITSATTIGDNDYVTGTIDGTVKFKRKVAPMLSVGYDWQFENGWSVNADLGAIVTGLKATAIGSEGIDQVDLNKEIADVQDELDKIPAIPYIAFGVNYRF